MKTIANVVLLLYCALWVSSAQAEIYSWTDENGVKHYSHDPPSEDSLSIQSVPEIKSDPTAYRIQEIINETNVEAIIEQLDQADAPSPPKAAAVARPQTRQERIAVEAQKLEDKIAWLDQLPPQAYTNTRSKQAIIGRYQYRLQQLYSNPEAYFKEYGY